MTSSIGTFRLIVVVAAALFATSESARKNWIPNTNFGTPSNWDKGRMPCSKDRVIVPRDAVVSSFVQPLLQVREIILPLNGELILPIKGEIDIRPPRSSDNCEGEDITFVATNARPWYDPSNWQVASSDGHLTKSGSTIPIPHSERVPCPSDHVVFPSNSSFKVHVEGATAINVGSFEINEKVLDAIGLSDFLASTSGRSQFRVDASLSVLTADRLCSDLSGCSCGNDGSDILKRICSHVTRFGCPVPQCVDPIVPAGSCCAICGSTLTVTVAEYFQFERLKSLYTSYLQKPEFETVSGYMFKTVDGQVQVVFADDSLMHRSKKLVEDIVSKTFSDGFERVRLNVMDFTAQTTTDWSRTTAALIAAHGLSAGGWIALIMGFLSFAFVGCLYFMQRGHLMYGYFHVDWRDFNVSPLKADFHISPARRLPFSFGRFENEFDRDGGFELGVELSQRASARPHEEEEEEDVKPVSEEIKGFDNPYYDQSCKATDKTATVAPTSPSQMGKSYETQHTRQNPCYMAFERVEDIPEAPEESVDQPNK